MIEPMTIVTIAFLGFALIASIILYKEVRKHPKRLSPLERCKEFNKTIEMLNRCYNAKTDTLIISSTEYKGERTGKNIIIPIKGLKNETPWKVK